MNFKEKVALVTGATSGIGERVARQLIEGGALVLGLGRNEEKGRALETLGQFRFISCDFADKEQVDKVGRRIVEDYPKVDILVNSAGISQEGTVETLSLEQWERSFTINVTGIFLLCKYIVPLMRKNGYGRIVNVASTAGTVGAPGLQVYATTKGAVIQLSRSMAASYARDHILVNCVCPGGTRTPMMENMEHQDMDEFAQRFPIGRLGTPEEIANVILFLASEKASFMVGSTVLVDGGFTCI